MPYSRPTLAQLESLAQADFTSETGALTLLRFAVLRVLAKMVSALINLVYGYLDWIAKMAVPYTSEDEYAYAWGALKGVIPKLPSYAGSSGGAITLSGCTVGVPIPALTPVVNPVNGFVYSTTVDVVVAGDGTAVLPLLATAPGAAGNIILVDGDPVPSLTLGTSIAGIQSSGPVTASITGGADAETPDQYKQRMLAAYQNQPQGGAIADYIDWSLAVAGVTRAWVVPVGMGAGTVVVYFMMDVVEAAFQGFPQGTNGVAAAETRAAPATGDQLAVANALFTEQPVDALVYACAPIKYTMNFTINGLAVASTSTKNGVAAAISGVLLNCAPGGAAGAPNNDVVDMSALNSAIAAVPGTAGFTITSPTTNQVMASGNLPILGVITWT